MTTAPTPTTGTATGCLAKPPAWRQITRQLLAFARKQAIVPRVLDLNVTVGGMLRMLKRLIGESIVLTWKPAHDLWPVKMDPPRSTSSWPT